ncbi:YcaO-like family protein [Streptomyces sp. NPDC050560]|uniref:YcaO-like family protein n=1 Tax=Streptomyces sp. NPDC050560 TaxID=3365630 RepID=UPI0037B57A3F
MTTKDKGGAAAAPPRPAGASGTFRPDSLVSPYGLVSSVRELADVAVPGLGYWLARGGVARPRSLAYHEELTGSGQSWGDTEHARLVAVAESAERYAGRDLLGEERVWASADELRGDCLEPERYPRCSAEEYARPDCRLVPFDPGATIRWTETLDLLAGEPVWTPSVLACYGVTESVPAEYFACRISTGFAVHTDPVEAVVRGLLEIVERDANALLWLQRLPLPPVAPEALDAPVRSLVAWCESRFRRVRLFDATTDLGIPVVYCVVAADHDPRAHRVVGAGAARDLGSAARKALLEAIGATRYVHASGAAPADPALMRAAGDTTRYMGLPEHAPAFGFLLDDDTRPPAPRRPPLPRDPREALAELLRRLAAIGARPVAADRTPRELADAGLTAVSVVVPDLQPMSLEPPVQFTAHPRLYRAPARMGHRVLSRQELNPWPQPLG